MARFNRPSMTVTSIFIVLIMCIPLMLSIFYREYPDTRMSRSMKESHSTSQKKLEEITLTLKSALSFPKEKYPAESELQKSQLDVHKQEEIGHSSVPLKMNNNHVNDNDVGHSAEEHDNAKERQMMSKTDRNHLVQSLALELKRKLDVLPDQETNKSDTCVQQTSIERSGCSRRDLCLQMQLPDDLTSRIEQLVVPSYMHPSPSYQKAMDEMRNSVHGHFEIIYATAASANHYLESKKLLSSLQHNVFPFIRNFTIIYYDIGLTHDQRLDIASFCKMCQIRDFPFHKFPPIVKHLKCYAWKPIIVHAHISRSNVFHWVDASIRFYPNSSQTQQNLYQLTKDRGITSGCTSSRIPCVTLLTTFHFFGDEACAYHPYNQMTAGMVVYHNELLIREAIVTPWVACALDNSCMCPGDEEYLKTAARCNDPNERRGDHYGTCHRFDQSVLSIIVRKLFQHKSHHVLRNDIRTFLAIERGDQWTEIPVEKK